VTFQHERHEVQRCVACHTAEVTLDANPTVACRECHESHHAAGRDCRACHGAADPKAAHAALADIHVACDNCHAEGIVAQLVPNRTFCQTCHADKARHHAERECTTCHFLASPEEFRGHLRKVEGEGA
jgi:DnaJ-class molecular chaperone